MGGTRVLGVDAAGRHGWVAVVVEDGRYGASLLGASLAEVVAAAGPVEVVAVDIPIGHVGAGERQADRLARAHLGPRRASVFAAPPPSVLGAPSLAEANRRLRAAGAPGLSAQAWSLVPRMVEAELVAAGDPRVVEVHPELSFAALAGAPLPWSKKTWAGLITRVRLLEEVGIVVPGDVGAAGRVVPDDLVDAAAVAWSAHRIATGTARCLPEPPQPGLGGRPVAIWF